MNAKKHISPILQEILDSIPEGDFFKTHNRMLVALKINDLIEEYGKGKSGFAKKLGKNNSEITKWISGTHNFTLDLLTDIAFAFNKTVSWFLETESVESIVGKFLTWLAKSGFVQVYDVNGVYWQMLNPDPPTSYVKDDKWESTIGEKYSGTELFKHYLTVINP